MYKPVKGFQTGRRSEYIHPVHTCAAAAAADWLAGRSIHPGIKYVAHLQSSIHQRQQSIANQSQINYAAAITRLLHDPQSATINSPYLPYFRSQHPSHIVPAASILLCRSVLTSDLWKLIYLCRHL